MAKEYVVFISHSWDHVQDLYDLRDLLIERKYFNVEFEEVDPEEPINSENAKYIKSQLKKKIEVSNIVIGLAGIYASHSDWMEWELDKALDLEIPIIGVAPEGQVRLSKTVTDRSLEDVEWDVEAIVNAIRRHANI